MEATAAGDWSLSSTWQQMSALLTQLDSHVLERKLRLCQAVLGGAPVDCEERVKLELKHFAAAGTVTFDLCCPHCSGLDRSCDSCGGSGRCAPVVLDLASYHPALDEAQLVARYLIMVLGAQQQREGQLQVCAEEHEDGLRDTQADQETRSSREDLRARYEQQEAEAVRLEEHELRSSREDLRARYEQQEAEAVRLEKHELRSSREDLRARYEQQEAEAVRLEEHELARRLELGGGEDDEDAEDEDPYDFDGPPVLTLDVAWLSRYAPGEETRARNALLAPELLRPVRKLTRMHCEFDPDWALQLLSDVSPRLEELQVRAPARRHLEVVEQMRHLDRLDVEFYTEEPVQVRGGFGLDEYVFRRPAVGARRRGLRWLRVGHMPKLTTFSLLRAHRHTLEEVWLTVGSWAAAGSGEDEKDAEDWPGSCRDLHLQLTRGGATWPRLRRLVLYRWFNVHDPYTCLLQTMNVQAALPGARVHCHDCSGQPFAPF